MRSRAVNFVCLLLLLSSVAVSDARAGGVERSRTPGGVFIRNLLLQAAVEEVQPATSDFGSEVTPVVTAVGVSLPRFTRAMPGSAGQTAHVHAVTGSSL